MQEVLLRLLHRMLSNLEAFHLRIDLLLIHKLSLSILDLCLDRHEALIITRKLLNVELGRSFPLQK